MPTTASDSEARITSRWNERTRTSGSTAAQTLTAETISTPRPAPMTPPALQPEHRRGAGHLGGAFQRTGHGIGRDAAHEGELQIGWPAAQRLHRLAGGFLGGRCEIGVHRQSVTAERHPVILAQIDGRSQPERSRSWKGRAPVVRSKHDPTDHPGRLAHRRAGRSAAAHRQGRDPREPRRPAALRASRGSPGSSASTTPCCPRWSARCSPGTTWCCSVSAARARPG